jgi:hypothetical protein
LADFLQVIGQLHVPDQNHQAKTETLNGPDCPVPKKGLLVRRCAFNATQLQPVYILTIENISENAYKIIVTLQEVLFISTDMVIE